METSQPAPQLTEDQIDDLIYFARVNDLEELQSTLAELSVAYACTPAAVFHAAVEDGSGNGPMHMAAANGHEATLTYLLSLCPSSHEPSPSTPTSTSTAPPPTPPIPPTSESTSTSTTPSTSPLNRPNTAGNTPLHWAAVNGHAGCARLLVGAGASISAQNAAKHDALDEAERAGRTEVVRVLLARMAGKAESEIVEAGEGQDGDEEEAEEGVELGEAEVEVNGGVKVDGLGESEVGEDGGGVRVTQAQLQRLGLDEKGGIGKSGG